MREELLTTLDANNDLSDEVRKAAQAWVLVCLNFQLLGPQRKR